MNNQQSLIADPTSLRFVNGGKLVGRRDQHNTQAWLGIPYATPPVGELRWCAPRPPRSWVGEYQALQFRSRSAQRYLGAIFGDANYIGDEDCLYLNVWSPCFETAKVPQRELRLPVMVYIPGGGNTFGGSDTVNAAKLAATHRVIVVTLNYRLGVFGWFSHPALHKYNAIPEDQSGNYGTLDMIAALVWVRDNISAFGGDADRITIMGSSAGGTNVRCLLVSPKAAGLFHRAIIQSSSMDLASVTQAQNYIDDRQPGHPQSSSELLLQLLIGDGLAASRREAKEKIAAMQKQDIAQYLRDKTLEQLESAYATCAELNRQHSDYEQLNMIRLGAMGSAMSIPKPFADGIVIPKGTFGEIFARGDYNRVPVVMGTNRDEDKTFLSFDSRYVESVIGGKLKLRDTERYNLAAEYLGKLWKAAGVDELAVSMIKFQRGSVFAYRMDWDEQGCIDGVDVSVLRGAEHCIEERFVFGGEDSFQGPEHPPSSHVVHASNREGFESLAGAIMSYWAEFAYSGKPGSGHLRGLPSWTAWDESPGAKKLMIFDTPQEGGVRMSDYFASRQDVFNEMESDIRLSDPEKWKNLLADIFNYFIVRITFSEYQALILKK